MFPYTPTQLYTMHSHHHHHHHHQHQHQHQQQQQQQQAMYAQQQQANMLFYQYNQLQSMHGTYSNPALTSTRYDHQQGYLSDQLVPQTPPNGSTPVQHPIQRSSPVNMIPISSPKIWMNTQTLRNPENFLPIIRTASNPKLDVAPFIGPSSNVGSNTSTPPMVISFESPRSSHRQNSKRHSYSEYQQQQKQQRYQQRRQRLHSGSSCYESDSPVMSSNEDEDVEWRPNNPKTLVSMSVPSKKRSHSIARTDLSANNEQLVNDIYQSSLNIADLFPPINPSVVGNTNHTSSTKNNNTTNLTRPKLLQYIEDNLIGKDLIFQGPWGLRRMTYCDYTASGRPLNFIENFIRNHVLPLYGNTHSETSLCAQQSTKFREEARHLIKKSVNANENDILLFAGTGSTGAVHTLVDNFDLHDETIRKNTVVIISAFEHHSNILPWKETGVEMVRIPTTQQGILDKSVLENQLQNSAKLNKRIICSLNAASNITGILTNVDEISTLAHAYGAYIFWDYATAAPYVKIDMNPSATAYKDAIFISTHKFVGGPGTPGLLIAKKKLFSLKAPKACGGGTVNFVTRTCREYNYDIEIREEGGTPDIIGCIRAGLVFQLKDSMDMNYLQAREDELVKRFHRRFRKHPTLILLGSQTVQRLPIFSFIIYVPGVCKYLHHNFVCLLLNDLFGIQVRSGCACAGPYALDLLNVNDAKTDIYCMFMTEDTCARGNDDIVRTMMMKPGFTRLNLSFFATDDEIDYVLNAVEFVASEGWKFLPLYTYNPVTAAWTHRSGFQLAQSSLGDISYKSGKMQYASRKDNSLLRGEKNIPDPFREAKSIANDAIRHALEIIDYTSDPPLNVPDKYKHMVWFALPIDIALMMVKQKETGQEIHCKIDSIPFMPADAKERLASSTNVTQQSNSGEHRKKRASSRTSSSNRVR